MAETHEGSAEDGKPAPVEAQSGGRDLDVVGRIVFAVTVAWVALAALPGALPWASTDDSQRVVFLGVAIATIVALVGLALAWAGHDDLRQEGGRVGVWASTLAIALAALDVVMVLLVPADAPYRNAALGIGLLIVLAAALVGIMGPSRTSGDGLLTGLRLTNISVIASVAALGLMAAYFLAVNTLFIQAKDSTDAQWVRFTDLLSGLEALAFAAAGALLGTTIQRQVTGQVEKELGQTEEQTEELNTIIDDVAGDAEKGKIVEVDSLLEPSGVIERALLESNTAFARDPERVARRRDEYRTAVASPATEFAREIRERQAQANRNRRRR